MAPLDSLTDAELTLGAQSGDTAALGVLLVRHQAAMRAVAMSVLGYSPDTDDAVQDAALTALRRIGDVRDPAAVGAWLRTIVRNHARMQLRSRQETPGLDGLDHLLVPDDELSHPERFVEGHARRDRIRDAVESLPPKLRVVLMLRHFSDTTAYEDIAAACDIPVGTVRSRLNQARRKMAEALLATDAPVPGKAVATPEPPRPGAPLPDESRAVHALQGAFPAVA
ncbi:sigma-70 family RNA polymerase sigma factor [Streptomycetaceae bacterium NBC_01309]